LGRKGTYVRDSAVHQVATGTVRMAKTGWVTGAAAARRSNRRRGNALPWALKHIHARATRRRTNTMATAGSFKCSPQVAVQVAAATMACSAVERLITVQLRLLPLARPCSPFGEKTRRTLGKISSSEYPCVSWSRKPNVRLSGQRHAYFDACTL
jgi:hypothetical protein